MLTTILQITIPAVLVVIMAYLLIEKLLKGEEARRNFEITKLNQPLLTPIKLRAYERLMLLLERITPHNMLLSKVEPNMMAFELQNVLLSDIRKEFEHNYSQQIYISTELWETIKSAQENTIQLINLCSSQCTAQDNAAKLATMIIKIYDSKEETALDVAKTALKNEVNNLMK